MHFYFRVRILFGSWQTRVLVWFILAGFAFIPISIVDRARSGLKSAVRQSTDNFQPNYHVSLATGLV